MNLIGILNWYEESPRWLVAAIASLARVGVNHVCAIDGAYFLFPGGRAHSGTEQACAILETAHALGMSATVHTPPSRWVGNEVEKRSFGFACAELVATPERDWYFVMDADQVVDGDYDLRAELEATDLDAGETTFFERFHPTPQEEAAARAFAWRAGETQIRNLFRAIPGLHVVGNHYTYVTPDGRKLWGNPQMDELVPALTTSVRIEHRTRMRTKARADDQLAYYRQREQLGSERSTCGVCREQRATRSLPTDWELDPEGRGLLAGGIEVCEECAPSIEAATERSVRALGFDPAELGLASVAGRAVEA